jgi:small subunit ribosomal protein S8
MVTDPIADTLTRIRNAHLAKHIEVQMPYSQMREGIIKVLEEYELVTGYVIEGEGIHRVISIGLAYTEDGLPRIEVLKRVSKPSYRKYIKAKEIAPVRGGFGLAIVSTSKGVMSSYKAREKGLGGELLALVW